MAISLAVTVSGGRVSGAAIVLSDRIADNARVLEGDIPNCSGKLHDPVKPAFRRLGILPQQLRRSPLFVHLRQRESLSQRVRQTR